MKKNTGFEKFANKKKAGTVKEEYRKERREVKSERAEAIKERILEKRKSHTTKPAPAPEKPKRSAIVKKGTLGAASAPVAGTGHQPASPGVMPLNKFIAHCGICARRDAAALVKEGVVTVNNEVVTEPGFKVTEADHVTVKGKRISITKNLVYILLNKPKDYITTTEDPQERKTVMELIKTATTERVYPIGRLDRNTSGVLLFTNDGELAQTLSHPKNQVKKIYEVKLDKALTKNDFDTIRNGITLEDGFVAPDALGYADPKDKTVIGIEIHSGRNRIVRRIFEHMKYDVRGLDRVMYAGLTKKNVTRGTWRMLTEKEVRLLKFFNKSAKKEKSAQ
ncbi:pseudouridine synthase [Flavihumibacter fluvii]|uniref:pseudouridine synthase n=1 Tax=Flavihumibacter fluvii TaxID=2838157 RepID=UPI001BDEEF04|nr:pseudouridine synthase [Flavihumibacter fluvii]ULQ50802.1 rRNA pseudouridine synthase [Flavihumibacter fluvii]